MDSAYAKRDYLSVKRTGYRGTPASYERKKNSAVPVTEKKSVSASSAVKSSPVRVGVRDTYRVSTKAVSSSPAKKSSVTGKEIGMAKGFIYVEHSGFTGTVRDVFCTKRVKSKEKSCFDKIVLTLLFAVLMFFVAGSYCEYYDAFKSTNEIRTSISECREEQAKLLVAIEERNNRLAIDEYAVNNLGMVKSDKLTTHYVSISEEDIVSITVDDESNTVTNGVLLSGFKSVMSNFTNKN